MVAMLSKPSVNEPTLIPPRPSPSPSTESGPADHKETDHYAKWRDAVADMMAEPRTNIKYINCFPVSEEGWRSG